MADIFPLALDKSRDFFDAESFCIRNVAPPETDSDVVPLSLIKEATISNCSSKDELLETLNTEIEGKTVANIILEAMLSSPTQEVIDNISKSLNTLIDDKPFGSTLIRLLLSFTSLNENQNNDETLKKSDKKKILGNSSNYFAETDSEFGSIALEVSNVVTTLDEYKKTFEEIYNKKNKEHHSDIVKTLFTLLLQNELTYNDCCDILTNYDTINWKKPLLDYKMEKRSKHVFSDQQEAVLVYESQNEKYNLVTISPPILKYLSKNVVFQNICVSSMKEDVKIDQIKIVDANKSTIEGTYSSDTNTMGFNYVENVFNVTNSNVPSNSILVVTADFFLKKSTI